MNEFYQMRFAPVMGSDTHRAIAAFFSHYRYIDGKPDYPKWMLMYEEKMGILIDANGETLPMAANKLDHEIAKVLPEACALMRSFRSKLDSVIESMDHALNEAQLREHNRKALALRDQDRIDAARSPREGEPGSPCRLCGKPTPCGDELCPACQEQHAGEKGRCPCGNTAIEGGTRCRKCTDEPCGGCSPMDEMGETACTDGEDEFPDEPTSPPVEEEADEGTSPSPAAEEEETTAGCDRPNYTICYPKERPWEPICMNCSTRVPLYLLSANYSDERPCPKCGGHLCFPPKFPKEWKLAPVVDAFHCGCGQYRDRIYSPQCDRCRTKLKPKMEEEESQPATDATDRGPAS